MTPRVPCSAMRRNFNPARNSGRASPSAARITTAPAVRTDIISNTLRSFASARTPSAAMMKENSVPLIQNRSRPIFEGAWPE